ncbi:hypothetical protein [Kitasatospora sp. NPDC086791]|uniref:hypothetical protein n=1 Tax=Kitasatospora sp. NPDC086791 TaxID=3155178 RepID=UPI00342DE939
MAWEISLKKWQKYERIAAEQARREPQAPEPVEWEELSPMTRLAAVAAALGLTAQQLPNE